MMNYGFPNVPMIPQSTPDQQMQQNQAMQAAAAAGTSGAMFGANPTGGVPLIPNFNQLQGYHVPTPFGTTQFGGLPHMQTPRGGMGGGKGNGKFRRNGGGNGYLAQQVEAIGNSVAQMGTAMATQQYTQQQHAAQKAAAEAQEAAEEKAKKQMEELGANVLAAAKADSAATTAALTQSLTKVTESLHEMRTFVASSSSDHKSQEAQSSQQTGSKRARRDGGTPIVRGKARPMPKRAAAASVPLARTPSSAKRIDDSQKEDIEEELQVVVDWEQLGNAVTVGDLVNELDQRTYGSTADWEAFYLQETGDRPQARWLRAGIIHRLVLKAMGIAA